MKKPSALRPCDVRNVDGVLCVEVSSDAGQIKTENAARFIPVHSAIRDELHIAQVLLQSNTLRVERRVAGGHALVALDGGQRGDAVHGGLLDGGAGEDVGDGLDRGDEDQVRQAPAGEQKARDPRADDVADAEQLGRDLGRDGESSRLRPEGSRDSRCYAGGVGVARGGRLVVSSGHLFPERSYPE